MQQNDKQPPIFEHPAEAAGGAELPKRDEMLSFVIDRVPALLTYADANLRYVYVNKAYADWYDRKREDIIGKHIHELLAAEVFQRALPHYRRALAGDTVTFENKTRNKDGEERFVSVRLVPYRSGSLVTGFFTAIIDITERKQIEAELHERIKELKCLYSIADLIQAAASGEELLAQAVQTIPAAMIHAEHAGARIIWKDRDFKTVNFRQSEWRIAADLVIQGEPEGLVEVCYPEMVPASDGNPFVKEERELIKVIAERLGRFIERDRAAEKLLESEERFRRVSSLISDIVYSCKTDAAGVFAIDWMTGAAERITGYSILDIKAEKCWRFMVIEEDLALFEKHVTGLTPGLHGACELRIRCKDGKTVWLASYAECVADETTPGSFILYGGLLDITARKRMDAELRESEKKYRQLSIVDELTRLYNSRYFYVLLKSEIERSNRYKHPLTLLLLDIDNFKDYNDSYGHLQGDRVLSRLGEIFKSCLRQTDAAFRYGGEEFTVLLPMAVQAEGIVTAERIRKKLREENFISGSDRGKAITLSIGLAEYRSREDMREFINRVDQFMYQAKKEGKDRVCYGTT